MWQGTVQDGKLVPAHTPLDLLHRLSLTDQNPQGFAIERIARFQLAHRQRGYDRWVVHAALQQLSMGPSLGLGGDEAMPPDGGNCQELWGYLA